MIRLVVAPDEQGLRLDSFLATATDLSRRGARGLIAEGFVARNGRPVRVQSRTLDTGDVVDLLAEGKAAVAAQRQAPPRVSLLDEDSWIVVVDKPAGVLSQPIAGSRRNELSLDQQLLLALAMRDGSRPFLRLVHRLDRLTSGAVLFARNRRALKALADMWGRGDVERLYLAVVEGDPEFETRSLQNPIARDLDHPWRFQVSEAGSPACTEVEVLHRLPTGRAVMRCRLITGRTHQVRVHLAAAGHPVLGDMLYGARRVAEVGRPMLHANVLSLPHPKTGDPLRVTAPLPDDFRKQLGTSALDAIDTCSADGD